MVGTAVAYNIPPKEFVLNIEFTRLIEATSDIAEAFDKWENDPDLIPFIRPNPNKEALLNRETVTVESLKKRLQHHHIYLIQLDKTLVGEMDFQIDPPHLYKKETSTAWIGINIGEA